MKKGKTVDEFILSHPEWQEELVFLRNTMNATEMKETVKWGAPTYTVNGKNVVGLGAFKSYVGLWFFQGVFLLDDKKVLVNVQKGVTKAMRQWRFNSFEEMDKTLIKKYLEEAIENQKADKALTPQKKPLSTPAELQFLIDKNDVFSEKFKSLSLTCKREYADYINEAKLWKTKHKRLEKIIPMILEQKGLNDKYR